MRESASCAVDRVVVAPTANVRLHASCLIVAQGSLELLLSDFKRTKNVKDWFATPSESSQ